MTSEARLALDPVPGSAALARQFVGETLAGWGCDDFVEAGRLLVSELVTNAILHARTSITVVVRLHRTGVRVDVHDSSPSAPVARDYGEEAMTGRGLALVNDLAARWGVDRDGSGKSVWFELHQ